MTEHVARIIEWIIIGFAVVAALILVFLGVTAVAHAHDHYTGLTDPVTNARCCGGHDCTILKIESGVLDAEEGGYRIRLTAEQANKINRFRYVPLDTLISWDRIQPSWDSNFHICIPTTGEHLPPEKQAYCFWAPPDT